MPKVDSVYLDIAVSVGLTFHHSQRPVVYSPLLLTHYANALFLRLGNLQQAETEELTRVSDKLIGL